MSPTSVPIIAPDATTSNDEKTSILIALNTEGNKFIPGNVVPNGYVPDGGESGY